MCDVSSGGTGGNTPASYGYNIIIIGAKLSLLTFMQGVQRIKLFASIADEVRRIFVRILFAKDDDISIYSIYLLLIHITIIYLKFYLFICLVVCLSVLLYTYIFRA